ncbi:threonylcarbamoyladenosine tRNA methylthiotransferase [Platysternon megacephalum]|uniref:Threonylcarbamoyladenosine tRNA methylthiotransferase n=1 Tax=Platysternon megacephalum TaxID=55544 RepID=A0A4D9EEF3_9SAUR|nr:threonylcarbamoyladenosine tRNA methylthiotransferase [Platysternon megacephalum]
MYLIEREGGKDLWNVMSSSCSLEANVCNKVVIGAALRWLIPKESRPHSRHRMGAGRMMWWNKCVPYIHTLILSPSTHFIFLENHLLKKQLLHSGDLFQGEEGCNDRVFQGGGLGFLQKEGGGWLMAGWQPAGQPVCMCTYAHIHLLGSVYLMHTHVYIPIHKCKWCIKSTSVRVGVCIAYIFTCTISRCV